MNETPDDTTSVVRQGVEQACKFLSERIVRLGFVRTKKMYWTRQFDHTVDFIHLNRSGSSYGKPMNYSVGLYVEFGIRVLNDSFEALVPNGPFSDSERLRVGLYHLRFNAKTGSTYDRCVEDLVRFVLEQGEPWFNRFRIEKSLISLSDSPLRESEKEHLRAAIVGNTDLNSIAMSFRLLGIKPK